MPDPIKQWVPFGLMAGIDRVTGHGRRWQATGNGA